MEWDCWGFNEVFSVVAQNKTLRQWTHHDFMFLQGEEKLLGIGKIRKNKVFITYEWVIES